MHQRYLLIKILNRLNLGIVLCLSTAVIAQAGGVPDPQNVNNQTLSLAQSFEDIVQTELGDPFIAWDDKLKNILMEQLVATGYDEKVMGEEAAAVNAIWDKDEREKAKAWFYDKYRNLAVQGLRDVAALVKNSEADTIITNIEKVLQSQSRIPEGNVPIGIAFIYQQIAAQTLELADSPCATPLTRIGCLFALIVNRECAYIHPSSIATEQRFPEVPIRYVTGTPGIGTDMADERSIGWNSNGLDQYINTFNTDSDALYRAGFRWPLKVTDHAMCVEMTVNGRSYLEVNVPVGDVGADVAWRMSLDGYGISRPGEPASFCSFSHEVSTDTFSDRQVVDIRDDNPPLRACWFRNIEQVYSQTFPRRPFSYSGDPDTRFAASVDIASYISGTQHSWGAGVHAHDRIELHFSDFGILILRDRN